MKAVVQRSGGAEVSVDGEVRGSIKKGFVVLLGVERGDTSEDADYIADKLVKLRIFEDENEKMNLNIEQVGGEMLIISQFTLITDIPVGNRPYFGDAEAPERANELYEYVCGRISRSVPVSRGVFGARMRVELVNDGPVTIIINSRDRKAGKKNPGKKTL